MSAWFRIPLQLVALLTLLAVAFGAVITGAYYYVEPGLPSADEIREASSSFQTPLRMYGRDGDLISQYGEQFRTPARLAEIPRYIKEGILAAEDDRFYEHAGIDLVSTLRAVVNYAVHLVLRSEERPAGGSTITQQVTRTTELLSRDVAVGRKIAEIFLAYRIEREFTKDEILELYLNTYFFGQRSYGVVSAARTYFNKPLSDLTLSEAAIIAGIPTAPSVNNPYNGPENARRRRDYVLRRMHELGFISAAERQAAALEPIISQKFEVELELEAGHVADMVIEWCQQHLGDLACRTKGLRIWTTIDSRAQRAATRALRSALDAYDRDRGYRGPIGRFDLASIGLARNEMRELAGGEPAAADALAAEGLAADSDAAIPDDSPRFAADTDATTILDTLLGDFPDRFGAEAGVVLGVDEMAAEVYLRSVGVVSLGIDAVRWARPFRNDNAPGPVPTTVADLDFEPGDVIRVRRLDDSSLELAQVPEPGDLVSTAVGDIDNFIEGALVSVDPMDGAIVALTGSYAHSHSPFNRASVGKRQPGSSFKPFFYLSALDRGYTLSTMINDVYDCYYDPTLERRHCVQNFSNDYPGLTRLREVLINSKNAAADRVIRDIGASYAANYVQRFGFDPRREEINSSLALGGMAVTPLELAAGYAMLANGGHAVGILSAATGDVEPYFIQRVENADGEVLYDARRSVRRVCPETEAESEGRREQLITQPGELYPRLRCAERVESSQRIWLITDVLKDVINVGSGARAGNAFSRSDLAAKTGTTNGPRDAWFAGFNSDLVAVARVGYDDDTRLMGSGAQGGRTAIPAWIDYMSVMLEGQPEHALERPNGIIERRINPDTGLIAAGCNTQNTRLEYFLYESQPARESDTVCLTRRPAPGGLEPQSGAGDAGSLFP